MSINESLIKLMTGSINRSKFNSIKIALPGFIDSFVTFMVVVIGFDLAE